MRISTLELKNIGTFKEAKLDFIGENGSLEKPPVTILTGENGTGKTLILDAIRGILMGQFGELQRSIVRVGEEEFLIDGNFHFLIKNELFNIKTTKSVKKTSFKTNGIGHTFNGNFIRDIVSINNLQPQYRGQFVINFWKSGVSSESFEIKRLISPNPEEYLFDALSGNIRNTQLVELITFFDYLKTSDAPNEKELGEKLFEILKKIIKISLLNGELKYIERKTLTPIISQMGQDITFDKLSSGNLYLIQRLVSLLGQMYATHVLTNSPISELGKTHGLLLIDEAENHLHPKWQKTFLNSILEIFPNLQIIVTTHSPFIVCSVPNARVYVCKSMGDYSIVEDESANYANKNIEEILVSDVFNTQPYSKKITELLEKRKKAIESGDSEVRKNIEEDLKKLNPHYFGYFDIDNLLSELTK